MYVDTVLDQCEKESKCGKERMVVWASKSIITNLVTLQFADDHVIIAQRYKFWE